MKFALVCALAFLAIAGPSVEGFSVPINMGELKEKIENLKNVAMEHFKGKGVHEISETITKTIHAHMSTLSKVKIENPMALHEATKHFMYLYVSKSLEMHESMEKTSTKMIVVIKKAIIEHRITLPKIDEKKMAEDLTAYQKNSALKIENTFERLMKEHGIDVSYGQMNELLKQYHKSFFTDKMWTGVKTALQKICVKTMSDAIKAKIEKVLCTEATKLKECVMNEMNTILKKHGITFPAATIEHTIYEMNNNFLKHFESGHIPVEMALKDHYNRVMDLMIKAYGNMDNADVVKMMEKLRDALPHIMEAKIDEMKKHYEKSGHKMCRIDLMRIMQSHLQPKPEPNEDDRHHNHHHHHHHHHHHPTFYAMIFSPIGGILIIIAVAVGIYFCIHAKRRNAEEFDDVQKPPSKKTNPYNHLEETHSVSKA